MTRENVLDEAKKCVCGQREQDYGSPESNFSIIADLWSAYTGHKYTPVDVANMMILLKLARIKNGGGTGDSFVDIAGYAACGGEIHSNDSACGGEIHSNDSGDKEFRESFRKYQYTKGSTWAIGANISEMEETK